VELHEGAAFDPAALQHHCRATLPAYKVPREIRRRATLPRNPTGKILRRALNAETPSEG
jgi:fatty-acyl-CoA synthase